MFYLKKLFLDRRMELKNKCMQNLLDLSFLFTDVIKRISEIRDWKEVVRIPVFILFILVILSHLGLLINREIHFPFPPCILMGSSLSIY